VTSLAEFDYALCLNSARGVSTRVSMTG
jgi:hypothetical protein